MTSLTPKQRAAVVLAILKGETTAGQAARDHGLTPADLDEWQRRFLAGAEAALEAPRPRRRVLAGRAPFLLAALAIGAIWIGLRLFFWNGYYTEDAPGYVTDAIYAAVGDYHARTYVNGLNVGTYLPVALPLFLFGKTEAALSLWPLTCSILGVLALAWMSARLFGRRFGWLAAILYVTYPGDVFFSTVVMPDAMQAGWVAVSMLLIVLATTGAPARARGLLIGAGMAMGICHLIRAGDAMFLPVGAGSAMIGAALAGADTVGRARMRRALSSGAMFLAGWALVIALEGAAYYLTAGDFLLRWHAITAHYGTMGSINTWGLNFDPRTLPFSLFPPAAWWTFGGGWRFNQDQAYHGLLFCWALAALVAGAAAWSLSKASRAAPVTAGFASAALWFGWPLLYHQFGSQSLTQFVPMHRLSRHFVAYAPGAVFATVAGCAVLARATQRWRARHHRASVALGLAGVALLAVHLSANWRAERIAHGSYQRIKATYSRVRQHLPDGVRTIIGDPGDLCFFDFWLNPLGREPVKMIAFPNFASCEAIDNAVVLTQANPGWEGLGASAIQEAVQRLPCLVHPPPQWRLLYGDAPEKVFVVGDVRAGKDE